MHNQALIIHPQNITLEDVMYPYQEVDKSDKDKMNDERCQWILTVPETNTSLLEKEVEKYLIKHINRYLEILQYRVNHSYNEWITKYDRYCEDAFGRYRYYMDKLNEFNELKELPYDTPKIGFLKEFGEWASDKPMNIYIKGEGFGVFHNPYEIWDYYNIVNEGRFPRDTNFLISKNGEGYNRLLLDVLDIPRTVSHIKELTLVWEYIIFCEKDPKDSRLYTIDDIRFDYPWNKHCRVEDLKDVLMELQETYTGMDYMVTAIDFHW